MSGYGQKPSLGPLFDAKARTDDPATSKEAARRLNARDAQAQRRASDLAGQVALHLATCDLGGTSAEIARALGVGRDSVSPRMKGLEKGGYVVRTHERREGQTVWRRTAKPWGGDVS